jgi:hypothetical protein
MGSPHPQNGTLFDAFHFRTHSSSSFIIIFILLLLLLLPLLLPLEFFLAGNGKLCFGCLFLSAGRCLPCWHEICSVLSGAARHPAGGWGLKPIESKESKEKFIAEEGKLKGKPLYTLRFIAVNQK